jgi:hypothetical protein
MTFAVAIAYVTGGAVMLSATAAAMVVNVALTLASMAYQRNRAAKAASQAAELASAQKGLQTPSESQIINLPVVYGRNKIGGARVYHYVTDGIRCNDTWRNSSDYGFLPNIDNFIKSPDVNVFLSSGDIRSQATLITESLLVTKSFLSFGFDSEESPQVGDGGGGILERYPRGSATVSGTIIVSDGAYPYKVTLSVDPASVTNLSVTTKKEAVNWDTPAATSEPITWDVFLTNIAKAKCDEAGVIIPGDYPAYSNVTLSHQKLRRRFDGTIDTSVEEKKYKFISVSGNNIVLQVQESSAEAADSKMALSHNMSNGKFFEGTGRRLVLWIQQAIAFGGINKAVYLEIDEKAFNSPALKGKGESARVHVCTKGGVADPLLAYNLENGWPMDHEAKQIAEMDTRANARFENTAYATGIFMFDRDDPQFSGVPSLQFHLEGRLIRPLVKTGTTITFGERVYSNNPSLVLLDYLMDADYGKGLSEFQVELNSFYEAMLLCDRKVQVFASATTAANFTVQPEGNFWKTKLLETPGLKRYIKLYECNMGIDTSKAVVDNIETILETMGAAELVWSAGKYKLNLAYPTVYVPNESRTFSPFTKSTVGPTVDFEQYAANKHIGDPTSFTIGDVVQFDYDDDPKSRKLYRCTVNGTTIPPATITGVLNPGWTDAKSDGLIVATLTDDDIILGGTITQVYPSAQQKLNFCTVKFLNEDKDFEEDSVSWPPKYENVITEEGTDWIGTVWNQKYPKGSVVKYGGFKFKRGSDLVTYLSEDDWNKRAEEISPNVMTYPNPIMDSNWIKECDNTVYKAYIAEDSGIACEKEIFQTGDTTAYHANNTAENLVRLSRDAIVYTLSVDRSFIYLEPGDFVKIYSEALNIPGELTRVEEVKTSEKGDIELQLVKFDARNLAWNAIDNAVVVPTNVYTSALPQASDLDFIPDITTGLVSGLLIWKLAMDVRVTFYRILVSTSPKEAISLKTAWMELGNTHDNKHRIERLAGGLYSLAVVASGEGGLMAPQAGWPVIAMNIDDLFGSTANIISIFRNAKPTHVNAVLGADGVIIEKARENSIATPVEDPTKPCVYDFFDDSISNEPKDWYESVIEAEQALAALILLDPTLEGTTALFESRARVRQPIYGTRTTDKIVWGVPRISLSNFQELIIYTKTEPSKTADGKYAIPDKSGVYSFVTNRLNPLPQDPSQLNIWTDYVPQTKSQLWTSYATAWVTEGEGVDSDIEWTVPDIAAYVGASNHELKIYTRYDMSTRTTKPVYDGKLSPEDGSFNFDTGVLTPPLFTSGVWAGVKWSINPSDAPSQDPSKPGTVLYSSVSFAQILGSSGVDNSLEWEAAVVDGTAAVSTVYLEVFTRDPKVIAPGYSGVDGFDMAGATYNFETEVLTIPSNFSEWRWKEIPEIDPAHPENTKVYVTTSGAVTYGNIGIDNTLEWTKPIEFKAMGSSYKDITIFTSDIESTNGLASFTGGAYSFNGIGAEDVLYLPNSTGYPTLPANTFKWKATSEQTPDDYGKQIYVSHAVAQIIGVTGKDTLLTWSKPVLFDSQGETSVECFVFSRKPETAAGKLVPPIGGSFDFDNDIVIDNPAWNGIWKSVRSQLTGTDPLYESRAIAKNPGGKGIYKFEKTGVDGYDWSEPRLYDGGRYTTSLAPDMVNLITNQTGLVENIDADANGILDGIQQVFGKITAYVDGNDITSDSALSVSYVISGSADDTPDTNFTMDADGNFRMKEWKQSTRSKNYTVITTIKRNNVVETVLKDTFAVNVLTDGADSLQLFATAVPDVVYFNEDGTLVSNQVVKLTVSSSGFARVYEDAKVLPSSTSFLNHVWTSDVGAVTVLDTAWPGFTVKDGTTAEWKPTSALQFDTTKHVKLTCTATIPNETKFGKFKGRSAYTAITLSSTKKSLDAVPTYSCYLDNDTDFIVLGADPKLSGSNAFYYPVVDQTVYSRLIVELDGVPITNGVYTINAYGSLGSGSDSNLCSFKWTTAQGTTFTSETTYEIKITVNVPAVARPGKASIPAFTATKVFSVKLIKDGENAVYGRIIPSYSVIHYDEKGLSPNPGVVNFTIGSSKFPVGSVITWEGATPNAGNLTAYYTSPSPFVDGTLPKLITLKANGKVLDTQTISSSRLGKSSPLVSLNSTSYVVSYDKAGLRSSDATIALSADLLGGLVINSTASWKLEGSSGSLFYPGLATGLSNIFTPLATYDATKTIAKITYTHTASVYADTITILSVKDGSESLSATITNESVVLNADSFGTVQQGSMSFANGRFKVYYGSLDVTDACSYSITDYFYTAGDNNSASTRGYLYFSTAVIGEYYVTSTQSGGMSGMEIMDATMQAAYTIPNTTKILTVSKTLTIAKARNGAEGKALHIDASGLIFKYNKLGTSTDSSITLDAVVKGITSPAFTWKKDGTSLSTTGSRYTVANTIANIGTYTCNETTSGLSDSVKIIKLEAGSDALQILIDNDNITFPISITGTTTGFGAVGGSVHIYRGAEDISSSCDITVTVSDNTIGATISNRVISINSWSGISKTGSVIVKAVVPGTINGTGSSVTLTGTISMSRLSDGATGATGNYVDYIFKSSILSPGKPPATNWASDSWVDTPSASSTTWWMSFANMKASDGTVIGSWSLPTAMFGDKTDVTYSIGTRTAPGSTWSTTIVVGDGISTFTWCKFTVTGPTGTTYTTALIQGEKGVAGGAGVTGNSAVTCYMLIESAYVNATANKLTIGHGVMPSVTEISSNWGLAAKAAATTTAPTSAAGYVLWVSFGIKGTTSTVWDPPVYNKLSVNELSAISTNTGALTVTNAMTLGANGNLFSAGSSYGISGSTLNGLTLSKDVIAIGTGSQYVDTYGIVQRSSSSGKFFRVTSNTNSACVPTITTNLPILGYKLSTDSSLPSIIGFQIGAESITSGVLDAARLPATNGGGQTLVASGTLSLTWNAGGYYTTYALFNAYNRWAPGSISVFPSLRVVSTYGVFKPMLYYNSTDFCLYIVSNAYITGSYGIYL